MIHLSIERDPGSTYRIMLDGALVALASNRAQAHHKAVSALRRASLDRPGALIIIEASQSLTAQIRSTLRSRPNGSEPMPSNLPVLRVPQYVKKCLTSMSRMSTLSEAEYQRMLLDRRVTQLEEELQLPPISGEQPTPQPDPDDWDSILEIE